MEARPAAAARVASSSRRWWLPVGLALIALLAVTWWWRSEPVEASPRLSAEPMLLPGNAGTVDGDSLPPAATIIDDIAAGDIAAGDAGPAMPATDLSSSSAPAMPTTATAAAAGVATDAATANPFMATAAPPPVATPSARIARPAPPRKRAAAPQRDEPDLLAILLGNIKPGQSAPSKGDGSGLDAFIREMEAEPASSGGVVSADENHNGRPQRPRSQQIQSNLRECPPANTAKGLKCRQDICEVYAGRDPACPASG